MVEHFRRHFKEEKKRNKKEKNNSNDEYKNISRVDGGDAFVVTLATHASQSVWLIDFGVSFHMTSHQH
jgi:hypothetical protein